MKELIKFKDGLRIVEDDTIERDQTIIYHRIENE